MRHILELNGLWLEIIMMTRLFANLRNISCTELNVYSIYGVIKLFIFFSSRYSKSNFTGVIVFNFELFCKH